MKTCNKCHQNKKLSEYYPSPRNKGGVTTECKACCAARSKAYNASRSDTHWAEWWAKQKAADPDISKRQYVRQMFKITLEEYREALASTNGVCGCCGDTPDKLVLDHSHETGKVREPVCPRCNIAIGYVESPVHDQAVQYVTRHRS